MLSQNQHLLIMRSGASSTKCAAFRRISKCAQLMRQNCARYGVDVDCGYSPADAE